MKVLDEDAKEKKLPEFRGGIMGVEILSVEQLKQLADTDSKLANSLITNPVKVMRWLSNIGFVIVRKNRVRCNLIAKK